MNAGDLAHQELTEKANRVAVIMEEVDEKTMRWMELDERAG